MQVILAEAFGMCFGVRDALDILATLPVPADVTIHGELVHNETVLVRLDERGFRRNEETHRDEIPPTPSVLITAHGVSDRERERLQGAGKQLIDTTCPLVARAHEAAQRLRSDGYHVLVLGRRGHVEVRGLTGDLESCDVIESIDDVRDFGHSRLGIICQTTIPSRDVERLHAAIVARNSGAEIRLVDTVCHPTKERQHALERLLPLVDAVVVVGGSNSNNTRQLAEFCRKGGRPALHVQSAADLQREWFLPFRIVGLTAGTSTLDETVEEVRAALERIDVSSAQTEMSISRN